RQDWSIIRSDTAGPVGSDAAAISVAASVGQLDARHAERGSVLFLQQGIDAVALLLEGDEVVALEHLAVGQAHPHRIDLGAVDDQLVMEVRAGRQAARADITDDLALADLGAR